MQENKADGVANQLDPEVVVEYLSLLLHQQQLRLGEATEAEEIKAKAEAKSKKTQAKFDKMRKAQLAGGSKASENEGSADTPGSSKGNNETATPGSKAEAAQRSKVIARAKAIIAAQLVLKADTQISTGDGSNSSTNSSDFDTRTPADEPKAEMPPNVASQGDDEDVVMGGEVTGSPTSSKRNKEHEDAPFESEQARLSESGELDATMGLSQRFPVANQWNHQQKRLSNTSQEMKK
uniref:Uncharacterized protein n=1 Tax=Globisporangium ultimum (strain ATCC 200006 / CBS 805.95 / DAOM BR144) TaxID=431595 RepID=K3XAN0_GLOUD